MANTGPLRAFRHVPYAFLWSTSTSYHVAYWLLYTALQLVISRITDHDPVALGILQFAILVPYLMLSVPFGVLVDRHDRRRLLRIAQSIGLTAFTTTALLAVTDTLSTWPAMAIGFVVGVTSTLTSATTNAMMPRLVPREDLTSAAPLQTATSNLGRMLGPMLAGPLVWLGGTTAMIWFSLAIVVLAIVLGLKLPALPPTQIVERESLLRSMAKGIDHAHRRPPAVGLLIAVAVTSAIGGGFQAQQPVVAAHVSPTHADEVFLILATVGGAAALVGVVLSALRRRTPSLRVTALLMIAQGLTVLVMGQATTPWVAIVCVALAQGLLIAVMTMAGSALQHIVDDVYRGRVMSLYFMGWGGLLPFGGLGLGVMIAWTSVPVALGVFGLVVVLVAVVLLLIGRRSGGRRDPAHS